MVFIRCAVGALVLTYMLWPIMKWVWLLILLGCIGYGLWRWVKSLPPIRPELSDIKNQLDIEAAARMASMRRTAAAHRRRSGGTVAVRQDSVVKRVFR